MAKQCGPLKVIGTFDNLCCYRMQGKYYGRCKSSLTRRKVKYSPRFRLTMVYAGLMGRASKIASAVYKDLPKDFRQFWMYRAFTGEAMQLLKKGIIDEQAKELLWYTYASVHHQPATTLASDPSPVKQIRTRVVSVRIIPRCAHGKDYRAHRKVSRVYHLCTTIKQQQPNCFITSALPP